jgi:uncharacterized protein YecE (DUF72 family)
MDAVHQEFENRKEEIREEMKLLFKANMTITDWDVPEVDDQEAAKILIEIMQEALDEIKADIAEGRYDFY